MKRNTLVLLATILATALAATAGGAERVYKWTDENGVVHYAASPPVDRGAERVTLPDYTPPSTPAAEEAVPAAAESGPVYAQAEPPDNSAIEAENQRRLCDKGRNMLAQLEPRPRVYRVDEDGNQVYLSDQERLDLIEEARQLMAENCSN